MLVGIYVIIQGLVLLIFHEQLAHKHISFQYKLFDIPITETAEKGGRLLYVLAGVSSIAGGIWVLFSPI
jgi:hypothetical protein